MPKLEDLPVAPEASISSDDYLLGHEQTLGKSRLFTIGALVNVFKTAMSFGTAAFKNVGTGANDVAAGNHGHNALAIDGLANVAKSGAYSDLSGRPSLGTAATKDVGTGANEVAAGVHGHTADDISDFEEAARRALEYITGAPVLSPAALRAIAPADRQDKQVRLCESNNFLYRYDLDGSGIDDDNGTIIPTSGPGAWFKIGGSGTGDTATLNGQGPSYYLNRANHSGTQGAGTITGLGAVATSNSYNDLDNKPTLGTVATTNSYLDLNNRPTLGTAASKNTGTGANDVATGNHSHTPSSIGAASATELQDEITRAQGAEGANATAITSNAQAITALAASPMNTKTHTLTGDKVLVQGDLRQTLRFEGTASLVTFPVIASYAYSCLVTNGTSGTLSVKKAGGTTQTLAVGETILVNVPAA